MPEIPNTGYQRDAVFQPGTGGVYIAPVGTMPPTLENIKTWLDSANRTDNIGEDWAPIGYTSIEDLPGLEADTEGGEKMGVFEDSSFRVSAITSTDTVLVKPVQWTEIPIKHRFGARATLDGKTGMISIPKDYVPVECAILVVFVDQGVPLCIYNGRVSSAPDGGIEADREQFLAMPIKYTVLSAPGNLPYMAIIGFHLQTIDTDGDGIRDIVDPTPGP